MSSDLTGPGALTVVTFATWVFQIHAAGVPVGDAEVAAACAAVDAAEDAESGDAAGMALVEIIQARLGQGEPTLDAMQELARALFGRSVYVDLGEGSREDRVGAIRKFQFSSATPWLARIQERIDGAVQPSWLLIERVGTEVMAMDPNPWNDIDEDRTLPMCDFQVLWELDGCASVRVQR